MEALQTNVTVISGQKAKLACIFSSINHELSLSSSHQLIWIRQSYGSHNGDSILAHNQDLLITDYRLNIQRTDHDYSLTITNVNIDDEGIYTCEVNTQPPQKAFIHLYVQEESHPTPSRSDDRFFVCACVILPFLAEAAYIFDAFYYHSSANSASGYEGLLSSILSVFIYLQYCAPLRSRYIRFFYHLSLWILTEVGTLAHIVYYVKKNDALHIILYTVWATVDTIYFICLICCRVFYKHRGLHVHVPIEQEHLFHFMSRLEVILALFIPVFFDTHLTTLTRDNIAFYILFDFFAESYHRFRGAAIKATLYIFVVAVTASVATEWLYIAKHEHKFEIASIITEIVAACFCYLFIVMQFFPGNFIFKTKRKYRHRARTISTSTTSAFRPARVSTARTDDMISYGFDSERHISTARTDDMISCGFDSDRHISTACTDDMISDGYDPDRHVSYF
ncbi:unnamed protein product [Rotaria sordida]|uniref:Ig-like domain-containing protein n=1 Tax=Rotaria sordida TaxID=392033 RepID=A0A818NDC1_9BILA|nr:unnamed protein product [Rotaria sordida]